MEERSVDRGLVQRPVVITVDGEPQGVVVQAGEAFRFLAVKLPAFAVDGQIFESVESARENVAEAVRAATRS